MFAKRSLMILAAAASVCVALNGAALAQTQFRISTAAAEGDWLNKALQKFKEGIEKDLPGQFAVSVHANASLFRQGTEVPAMQRGNLEMSTMTTFEVEQQLPEYGVLAAGYAFRDYDHMHKVFDGPIGKDYAEAVGKTMGIQIIDTIYLGTRQMNLAKAREV